MDLKIILASLMVVCNFRPATSYYRGRMFNTLQDPSYIKNARMNRPGGMSYHEMMMDVRRNCNEQKCREDPSRIARCCDMRGRCCEPELQKLKPPEEMSQWFKDKMRRQDEEAKKPRTRPKLKFADGSDAPPGVEVFRYNVLPMKITQLQHRDEKKYGPIRREKLKDTPMYTESEMQDRMKGLKLPIVKRNIQIVIPKEDEDVDLEYDDDYDDYKKRKRSPQDNRVRRGSNDLPGSDQNVTAVEVRNATVSSGHVGEDRNETSSISVVHPNSSERPADVAVLKPTGGDNESSDDDPGQLLLLVALLRFRDDEYPDYYYDDDIDYNGDQPSEGLADSERVQNQSDESRNASDGLNETQFNYDPLTESLLRIMSDAEEPKRKNDSNLRVKRNPDYDDYDDDYDYDYDRKKRDLRVRRNPDYYDYDDYDYRKKRDVDSNRRDKRDYDDYYDDDDDYDDRKKRDLETNPDRKKRDLRVKRNPDYYDDYDDYDDRKKRDLESNLRVKRYPDYYDDYDDYDDRKKRDVDSHLRVGRNPDYDDYYYDDDYDDREKRESNQRVKRYPDDYYDYDDYDDRKKRDLASPQLRVRRDYDDDDDDEEEEFVASPGRRYADEENFYILKSN